MAANPRYLEDGAGRYLEDGTDRVLEDHSAAASSKLLLRLATEVYPMRPILKGSTDQSIVIRIVDSADGTPETGVEHNTSGIDLWYRREGAAKVSITEAALSALTDAHSDGGIEHIGDGYYRLDLPDAAVATGANGVAVGGTVTGMVVIGVYIPLVDFNPYDGVRLGLTALPNAAADAAGGLPVSDAGGLDLDAQRADVAAILVDTGTTLDARIPAALVGGRMDASVGAVAANAITAAGIADGAIDAATFAADVDAEILSYLVDDATRIDASSLNTATVTTIPAILVDTAVIGAAGAGLTAVPWNAAWDAEVQSEVQDAIEANNLDHLVKIAVDTDFATTVHLNSVIGNLADNGTAATFDRTTDSMEAIRDRGDAAWATATGFSTLDAAGVRTAVGLASANLDTQLTAIDDYLDTEVAAIKAKTDQLTFTTANRVDGQVFGMQADTITASALATDAVTEIQSGLSTLTAAGVRTAVGLASANLDTQLDALPTAAENATAILAAGDVDGYTLEQTLKLCLAALAGKLSGAATTTVTIRSADDSANRLVATVDSDGNRTAVTLNAAG